MKTQITKLLSAQNETMVTSSASAAQVEPPSTKTLIIGDSMLCDISNDHFKNADVNVKRGATTKDIFQEVNSTANLSSYSDVIIHVGTNDVSNGADVTSITASMEAIITAVMVKSPTTRVHLSAVCPRLSKMDETAKLNQSLKDLSTRLDCGFIDIAPEITYQNGSIDTSVLADGLHLNKTGSHKLIKTFADAVKNLRIDSNTWTKVSQNRKRRKSSTQNRPTTKPVDEPNYKHAKYIVHEQKYQKRSQHNKSNFSDHSTHRDYSGCWKCGLSNHNASSCFYEFELQCRSCGHYGHKAKYCEQHCERDSYYM
jgi:hypothetical protein